MGFLRSEPGAASMFAHGNSRVNTDSYIIVTIFAKSSIQANPNQLLTWRFGNLQFLGELKQSSGGPWSAARLC